MAFGDHLDDENVMSEINVTPFVDVMLVLLIIFIITMPVITHVVKVDLPQVDNVPNQVTPESIVLSVTKDGDVLWNETPVTKDELLLRLSQASQQQPQPEMQIQGDRQVEYEHMITVMAAAQQAGISKLGFVTALEGSK